MSKRDTIRKAGQAVANRSPAGEKSASTVTKKGGRFQIIATGIEIMTGKNPSGKLLTKMRQNAEKRARYKSLAHG